MAQDAFTTIRWAREVGEYITDRQGRYYDLADDLLSLMATYAQGGTGEEVYPAIKTLARRKHKSTRDVRNALDRLEELGLVEETGTRFNRGVELTEWRLCIENEQFEEQAAEATYRRETERKAAEAARKRKARGSTRPVIEVQEAPDAPAEVVHAPVRDQMHGHVRKEMHGRPNFPRGIPKQLPAPEPEEMTPNLAEQLIEYVMPKLDPAPADIKHAKTILMKFADRWPRCLEMAQYATRAIESRPGSAMEIGCFEEGWDPNFAVPLNAKVEEAA